MRNAECQRTNADETRRQNWAFFGIRHSLGICPLTLGSTMSSIRLLVLVAAVAGLLPRSGGRADEVRTPTGKRVTGRGSGVAAPEVAGRTEDGLVQVPLAHVRA